MADRIAWQIIPNNLPFAEGIEYDLALLDFNRNINKKTLVPRRKIWIESIRWRATWENLSLKPHAWNELPILIL
jgi:hypothetical protein